MRCFNNVLLGRQGIAAVLLSGFSFVASADQMMRALPAPAVPQPVAALPAVQQSIPPAVVAPAAISPAAKPPSQPTKPMSLTGTSPAPINLVKCNVDGTPRIDAMNMVRNHNEAIYGVVMFGPTLHESDSLLISGCNFGKKQGFVGMFLSSDPHKGQLLFTTGVWKDGLILASLDLMPNQPHAKVGPFRIKIVALKDNGDRLESFSSEQFYFMNEKPGSVPDSAAKVKKGPLSPVATVMQGPLPEVIIDGGGMQIGGKFIAFGNTTPVSINSAVCSFPFQFPLKNIGAGKAENFAISMKMKSEKDQSLALNAPVGNLSLEPGASYTETHNGAGLNLVSGITYNFTVQIDSEHKLKQATPARTYSVSFKTSCGSVRKKPLPYIPIN